MEDSCSAAHGTQMVHWPGLTYGQPLQLGKSWRSDGGAMGCAYNSAGST